MGKYKQFIAGVIVGGVLLSGGNVLANNAGLPTITSWVKYKINGEEKSLPSGYTTINYEGHTYVPTRFIAEELGADVEWDDITKTISVNKQEINVEDDNDDKSNIEDNTDDEADEPSEEEADNYVELPVSKTIDGVRVEVYSIEEQPEYTKFYLTVKNTKDDPIQLNQESSYFQSESDKYANSDIRGGVLYWKDTAWFSDLKEDDEVEGYIMLPKIPKDEKQGKFYVEVFENSLDNKVMKYDFDIKW